MAADERQQQPRQVLHERGVPEGLRLGEVFPHAVVDGARGEPRVAGRRELLRRRQLLPRRLQRVGAHSLV